MAIPTVTITGHVLTPSGDAVTSGTIDLTLSAAGSVLDGAASERLPGGKWSGTAYRITLAAGGALPAGAKVVPNDAITPSGTYYTAKFTCFTAASTTIPVVWTEIWQLVGMGSTVAIGAIPRLASPPIGPSQLLASYLYAEATTDAEQAAAVAAGARFITRLDRTAGYTTTTTAAGTTTTTAAGTTTTTAAGTTTTTTGAGTTTTTTAAGTTTTTAAGTTTTTTSLPTAVMSDDFESYALYSGSGSPSAAMISANWVSQYTDGLVEIVDGTTVGTTGKVLRVSDTSATGGCGIARNFTATLLSYFRVRARAGQTNINGDVFRLMVNGGVNLVFGMAFRSDGYIKWSKDTLANQAMTTPFAYTANTWYTIELKNFNWSARTVDIYIGGSLVKAGAQLSASVTPGRFYVVNATDTAAETGDWWYDDIYLY
jgi:hypothetical protein